MRLFVKHRSEYRFSEPQARLVQLLRLTPGNHAGQSIVSWRIDVDRDARLKPARDGYGNETTMLYIDGPLDRIAIEVSGEVLTEDRAGMVIGSTETLPPLYYLQSTPLTKADAALIDYVETLGLPAEPQPRAHALAEALADLFEPVAVHPATDQSAAARFAARAADPQGNAHVLIAAARTVGLPARYVAGHLYRPDESDGHAAHGWAEIWIDGYGWIGFDAFEGCCPRDEHVRVAIGLDHREAAPISGLRIGGGHEALAIDVHVGPEPAAQD
ncbi:transglutaminase family protein [Sphingomonas sp. BIUV-7]|uniref:Transglutaminase family protein n=1 Tax=Sphingomonas natans TaxID=3063330 RepID=A0ABT8Y7M4_9SPHN|nr:transglutaminase family protein [Sphingomonas sp. BIUV-7]MDO6413908.1 transglutaminase family protein [Sphingomonas sp. BIUV-7]